ncbi:tripartite tricarboxylate transporter substrate binding protein [Candidimonas humi]|uniref:Bug family tripartite tricarboxylate transporter substrate binding protein n=1 Tax=Candidimonas humi TaxID=683355 RepID=A0ABV8NY57_9BURK|nr:tripartite tricarboxylate transporter substrate binding protein [Candidimonas humi]MBV6305136.1 tripartite tricarboxylate transporter substrate binding protein [Candidimonas humi]
MIAMFRKSALACTLAATSVLLACGTAGAAPAAQYPTHSVHVVVPFPPGGSNDVIARILTQKLTQNTGQAFVVENRGGAGGNVGSGIVAESQPDGYTLLLTASPPLTSNVALYKDIPFNPTKDFAPVALIASVPIVLVANPSTGITTLKGLIAKAKAHPGTLNFGSSGNGSTNHLAGELLKHKAGIDIIHVPYKGAAPALNDLLAGHIQIMFDNLPALLPHIRAKAINAIAVAGQHRVSVLPGVPTVSEAGVPGFDASAWFGLVAPAKTPPAVLAQLRAEVETALKAPDVKKRFEDLGAQPGTLSGEAFRKFMADETSKWVEIIKISGARVN